MAGCSRWTFQSSAKDLFVIYGPEGGAVFRIGRGGIKFSKSLKTEVGGGYF